MANDITKVEEIVLLKDFKQLTLIRDNLIGQIDALTTKRNAATKQMIEIEKELQRRESTKKVVENKKEELKQNRKKK